MLDKPVGKRKTCDTPMCDKCTHRAGHEEDYCREHRPKALNKEAESLNGSASEARILAVNFKHDREGVIYIGRAMPSFDLAASPLGNPYRVGVDPDPLGQYKKWLWRQMQIGSAAFDELFLLSFHSCLALLHIICYLCVEVQGMR